MRLETCSTTPRRASPRSSTRPAAAPAATCAVRTSCPGVDPFIQDGGLLILNPAAFATPQPGTNGNLERNSLHGPNFWQVGRGHRQAHRSGAWTERRAAHGDLQPLQPLPICRASGRRCRMRCRPVSLTEANRVQPGQPYTTGAGGFIRTSHADRRHNGGRRDESPDPAGVPVQFLILLGFFEGRALRPALFFVLVLWLLKPTVNRLTVGPLRFAEQWPAGRWRQSARS